MKPLTRALLMGATVIAIVAGLALRPRDRNKRTGDVLPPPVSGVPLNESKADGPRPMGAGTVVDVSNLIGNEAEVSLDVNPTNPDNLVIFGHAPNLQVINAFHTLDGGQSWTRVTIGNADDGLNGWLRGDPSVVFDDDGDVYVAYGVRQHSPDRVTVVVAKSTDGGQSFTQFTKVHTNPDIGGIVGNDKWHLATGPDPIDPGQTNVYVTWTQSIDEIVTIDQRVVIVASLDGGATFSDPIIVNDSSIDGTSPANVYVDPAVGPNGEVYVTWWNVNTRGIYVDYAPAGLAFGADVLIGMSKTGFMRRIPAQPSRGVFVGPSIDTDRSGGPYDGRLYVVYTDVGAGGLPDVDVIVQHSDDHGANWSPRVRANDDAGTSSQFLPWLDVDQVQGIVGVSFYDTRNDPLDQKVEIYVAPSYDGGETFDANRVLSAGQSDQSAGNPSAWFGNYLEYIGLALHDGTAWGVWSDNSTDLADLDFFEGRISVAAAVTIPELGDGVRGPLRIDAVFPNPSRERTQFAFGLAVATIVRLTVHDVSGRTLRVLVDEEREAGKQMVTWDGRDAQGRVVSPGTYFYRLESRGQSLTQKITIVR